MTTSLEEISAFQSMREELRRKHIEPMDEDAIELLKEELSTCIGRVNRLCNILIMRPTGLGEGCLDAVHDMKFSMSRIKWYLEQRDKPVIRKNIDAIRLLVEANLEANGPLGDAARSLMEVLPLGSQT